MRIGLILSSWLVVGAALAASSEELPLETDAQVSFTTRSVTWMSVDVAPSGEQLVIEVLGDLYTLPIDGGEATPLLVGSAFDSQPTFSSRRSPHCLYQRS